MIEYYFKCLMILVFGYVLSGCSGNTTESSPEPVAKNIILFIGDGMGAEHRKAARWLSVGKTGKLFMDDMPVTGWLETYSANSLITDSAASATAISTGVKTNNGIVSLDPGFSFIPTILEEAKSQGKFVGLVTTTHLSHATPAAFASHVESRGLLNDIAEQIFTTGVHVLLGGGEDEFLPNTEEGCYSKIGARKDGRNLVNEAKAVGFTYVCDGPNLELIEPSSTPLLMGIFADDGMIRPFSPNLADMTQKAIDILSTNPSGFFLMVEGGQIDWASHENDADDTISDTLGLDKAVEVSKIFASDAKETLIIVTADHETGGMSVSELSSGLPGEDGPFSTPEGDLFYINWSTKGHTAVNVPLTSQGPSSKLLQGVHDNTFVHTVMLSTLKGN